jgi:peptidoglycan/LPS O-acetylase OafA/YrhL
LGQVGSLNRSRLDSLTPLRFAAALVVFLFHFRAIFGQSRLTDVSHLIVQGPTGVSFFFILSGFVLTWSHRRGDTSRQFWRRRFARIYPLQFVSWAATGLILVFLVKTVPQRGPALASLLLLSPWTPNQHYINAMDVPCWSLGCEAFFYLLFPVLHRALQDRTIRERRMVMAGCVLAPLVLAAVFRHASTEPVQYWFIYYFPPVRLLEFVAGMLLAFEVRAGTWPRIPVKWAAGLALGAYVADGWAPISFMIVSAMVVPYVLLIGSLAKQEVEQGSTILAKPLLLRLGAWSYAFYLLHAPVLIVFAHFRNGPMGGKVTLAMCAGALIAATAAAALAFHIVERPAEKAIRGPGWRIPAATTVGAAVLGLFLGAPVAYAVVRQQVPSVTRAGKPASAPVPSSGERLKTASALNQRAAGGPPGNRGRPGSPSAAGRPIAARGRGGAVVSSTTATIGCQSGMPLGLSTCLDELVTVAPPRLCAVYRCDGDPITQTGYLVECQDGRVSMAGGTATACSDAGGVKAPLYLSAPAVTDTTVPTTSPPTAPLPGTTPTTATVGVPRA